MESVRELEERSNSFFDDQEEERIIAELNNRYKAKQGSGQVPGGKMDTEQFMKEMGVASDVLNSNQYKTNEGSGQNRPNLNRDLNNLSTPDTTKMKAYNLAQMEQSSQKQRRETVDMLHNLGGNLEEIGQFMVPVHPEMNRVESKISLRSLKKSQAASSPEIIHH